MPSIPSKLDLSGIRKTMEILESTRDVSVFRPDEAQKRAKSNFWSFFLDSGSLPPDPIELAVALQYGANRAISEWWSLPGFQDWFTNRDEFRQKAEFTAGIALDELKEIIQDKKANINARVAAIKIAFQIANKTQEKAKETYVDEIIGEMNSKQLEEFIKSKLKRLPGISTEVDPDIT